MNSTSPSLTAEGVERAASEKPAASMRPTRLHGALFQPIGDEGRAELVERRLIDAITRGHLRAGERLPSESDLARSLGVAPVTVREALLAVRGRGLIVTRRGRNGGSFITEHADPMTFAREALSKSSRLSLRDLGVHYSAITGACVRLAARRADPSEVAVVRRRLERLGELEADQQRRLLDDVQVELVALSQSARLTREQMKLQAEFSPLLALATEGGVTAETQGRCLLSACDAIDAGDPLQAGDEIEKLIATVIDALIALQTDAN